MRKRFARRLWELWMKFAEKLGTFQMMLLLSIVYWSIMLIMAIPLKIFSDPLKIKRSNNSNWSKVDTEANILESMKNQY